MTPSWATFLFVALGGALGAVARYSVVLVFDRWNLGHFPLATLTVNAIGAFLIGVFYCLITEKLRLPQEFRGLVIVGFLGALTTYSTYALDIVVLIERGEMLTALLYALVTLLLCSLLAFAGISVTRWLA